MNITFLTPTLESAGGTLVLRRYADHLVSQGHKVTIISPRRGAWEGSSQVTVLTYRPLPLRYADTLTFQLPYWRAILNLIPTDTDWIIPIYTPLLVPALRFTRTHPHTRILLLAQESMEVPIIGPYNRWLLARPQTAAGLSGIVTVAKTLTEQITPLVQGKVAIKTIPNGIDHTLFKPADTPREEVLLFVGRPNVTKGYPNFLKLLERLQESFPHVRGWVVAPPEPALSHPLIQHQIATPETIAPFYQRCRLYVNLSVAESFGFPPLEAMACGTPVVVTDTSGVRQYAHHEENCLVIPVNDLEAAVTACTRILTDLKLQETLVANGLETAKDYSWNRAEDAFAGFLAQLN